MKINNNISAIISNKHLLRNENSLAISMERLSSGFKINHAGDDPSGMAISSKMRAQIRGLDRASQNASDGLSVLETADGALNEVTDMIQRMRELSVQAANGTNSMSDRQSIQDEVDNLVEEIQRISDTAEFNTKKLLNGSLDNRVYTEGISRVTISNDVPSGTYDFKISEMPTQAVMEGEEVTRTYLPGWDDVVDAVAAGDQSIKITATDVGRSATITLTQGMTRDQIYQAIHQAGVNFNTGDGVGFGNLGIGDDFTLTFTSNTAWKVETSSGLAEALGWPTTVESPATSATDPDIAWELTSSCMMTPKEKTETAPMKWKNLGANLEAAMEEAGVTKGYIDINGTAVELVKGMNSQDLYTLIRKAAEKGEATISNFDEDVSIWSIAYGADASLDIQMDSVVAKALGVTLVAAPGSTGEDAEKTYAKYTKGTNAEITLLKKPQSDFGTQSTYTTLTKESAGSASRSVDGRRISITDVGGFQMDFLIDEKEIEKFYKEKAEKEAAGEAIEPYEYSIEITDVGPMNLQIGANENQQMSVRIDSIDIKKLYLDQVDVTTERGATRALEQLDETLAMVSSTRSNIGAYSNRLEHAIKSLDQTSENMNQAISRIQDSDIAKEMTEYTKYNVLQQASTSALSQANELPQTALQLLQ